jgi:hypothetical protein
MHMLQEAFQPRQEMLCVWLQPRQEMLCVRHPGLVSWIMSTPALAFLFSDMHC